jgi:hypothetical protein
MKRIFTLALLATMLLFSSCQKQLDISTEWQEMYVVYSLLNLKDSAHYVRVNRAFQTGNSSWQVADSVNVKHGDFEVILHVKSESGQVEGSILLLPCHDFVKDSGDFATENYFTFKTTNILQAGKTYQLTVHHLPTDYQMQAETQLLGKYNLDVAFMQQRCFTSSAYHKENIEYSGSLSPNQFDILFYRLLYEEISDSDTTRKYLNWKPNETSYKNVNDSTENQFTHEFLMYISENIEVKPNLRRIAIGIDKYLLLNDDNLKTYIDLIGAEASMHFAPEYTNFDKGGGLFASRYFYTLIPLRLKDDSHDTISLGQYTKHLNFRDSEGNWHLK